jgi:hypothetical protein
MKIIAMLMLLSTLACERCFSQGAQADMIKRRAKETANQNNVRQGVPPPSPSTPRPATPAAGVSAPVVTQAASIARLTTDISNFKPNTIATDPQKQQFTISLTQSARGTKPSLGAVRKLVDSLSSALATATLDSEQQSRLAHDLEAVMNARTLTQLKFDRTIDDTQAILEVGTVKRSIAVSVAADLKTVGLEVRR